MILFYFYPTLSHNTKCKFIVWVSKWSEKKWKRKSKKIFLGKEKKTAPLISHFLQQIASLLAHVTNKNKSVTKKSANSFRKNLQYVHNNVLSWNQITTFQKASSNFNQIYLTLNLFTYTKQYNKILLFQCTIHTLTYPFPVTLLWDLQLHRLARHRMGRWSWHGQTASLMLPMDCWGHLLGKAAGWTTSSD